MRALALALLLATSVASAQEPTDTQTAQATCEVARQTQNVAIAHLASALLEAGWSDAGAAVAAARSYLYTGDVQGAGEARGLPSLALFCGDLDDPQP